MPRDRSALASNNLAMPLALQEEVEVEVVILVHVLVVSMAMVVVVVEINFFLPIEGDTGTPMRHVGILLERIAVPLLYQLNHNKCTI